MIRATTPVRTSSTTGRATYAACAWCWPSNPGRSPRRRAAPAHAAANAPEWKLDEGTLTLFLPKGHVARLRYASFAHDRLVGHFGLPGWHDGNGGLKLRAEAMAGANWMLTPWRSLTLVHATQQPVCLPALAFVSPNRAPGEQHVDLLARRVSLHGPSTGKFEIVGEWEEWIDDPLNDDPAAPGPRRVTHEAQLAEIRLGENHVNVFTLQDAVRRQTEFTPVGGQVSPADLPGGLPSRATGTSSATRGSGSCGTACARRRGSASTCRPHCLPTRR